MCIVITMLYYTEKEHILNPFCHLPTVLMPGAAPDPRSSSTLKRNVDNSALGQSIWLPHSSFLKSGRKYNILK